MRPPEDLRLRIRIDRRTEFETGVIELALERTVVEFPPEEAPLLAVGQEVELRFLGGRLDGPVPIRAWVIYRGDRTSARELHFRLDRSHGSALQARLNRRRAFRVTPEPNAPIQVRLRGPEGDRRATAVLHDISESGLSALVGPDDEGRMMDLTQVRVQFALPGEHLGRNEKIPALDVVGAIRYRRLEGPAIYYGIEFDAEASADFTAQRRLIQDYVEIRRTEMMQRVRSEPHSDAA